MFPGFKLGRKKLLKSKESSINNAINGIKAKLGAEWTVEIDWASFAQLMSADQRQQVDKLLVDNLIVPLAISDVGALDDESVAIVNKLVGDNKKLVFSCSKSIGGVRVKVNLSATQGLTVVWNGSSFGSLHNEDFIFQHLSALPAATDDDDSSVFKGNWSLKELRTLRAKQSQLDQHVQSIAQKLGTGWTVDVDFASFASAMDASSKYRADAGKTIVDNLVRGLAHSDVAALEQETLDAINAMVGDQKKLTYKLGRKNNSYQYASRVNVDVTENRGIVVVWSAAALGSMHCEDFINQHVSSLPGVAVAPCVAGRWTLAELKKIRLKLRDVEAAERTVASKLGDAWTLKVDWDSFSSRLEQGSKYRADAGTFVVQNLIHSFANCDIGSLEQSAIDAINNIVGEKQVVHYSLGARNGSYAFGCCRVDISSSKGLSIVWSTTSMGNRHAQDFVAQHVGDLVGVAVNPIVAGNWTLKELAEIESKLKRLEQSQASLQAKLGTGWRIEIDWMSVSSKVSQGDAARKTIGKSVVENIADRIVSIDIAGAMDEDVVEALNDLVGDAQVLKIAIGAAGQTFQFDSRVKLNINASKGIEYTYNAAYLRSAVTSDFINQWVLENC